MSFDDVWAMWRDEDSTSPAIGFGGREKVAWDARKMARYFEGSLFKAKWYKGFLMVNIEALARQLRKWRDAGKTEDEVRSLINTYMTVPEARGFNPGWKDFLYRAEKIAAMVASEALQKPVKNKDALLDEAWETGTLEAFQRAFPDDPEKAQEQYEIYLED